MRNMTPICSVILMAGSLTAPGIALAHTDITAFDQSVFAQPPETVDCTLEDGTETSCHKLVVNYMPEGLEIGPFCPATLDDEGGIWNWTGENGKLYRIDGDFLRMLDGLGYRFFDDEGNVQSVDNATTRPTVDHACINVTADDTVKITMLVPETPVMADSPADLGVVGKVGVALDGVPIFSDAPSIQQTGHMPALDTCGGHIDPGGWYHWHATATDIDTVYDHENVTADCSLPQDSGAQFGYAFDGFPMFGSTEADGTAVTGLDECNGHTGPTAIGETYHYHSSEDFPNLPPCLVGVQAQDNFLTTATAGVGATHPDEGMRRNDGGPAGQTPPGFDEAAKKLGVTAKKLLQAMGDPRDGHPDLATAAENLGVTEAELRDILPPPPGH
ncbi:YHYH protein [Paracoccus sp. JM45]|uniref:YHYH protein n=1 Tax=Paracoccus sp. JM45 TaxID=2283626 RepID=UPI000E6C2F80|nr:YHYH protein [Paracoccus sp. JM45]RJE79630.1 YHYH protein [Paracoccus sp. JM45]